MRSEGKNFLDGCRHVFLDMGTNTGIQIRKLYEPHLFPNASVLPIFDKFFGPIGERLWRGSELLQALNLLMFQGPQEHLHSWVWTKCFAQRCVGRFGGAIPGLWLAGWFSVCLSQLIPLVVFRCILLLPLGLGLRRNLIWILFIKRFEQIKLVCHFYSLGLFQNIVQSCQRTILL